MRISDWSSDVCSSDLPLSSPCCDRAGRVRGRLPDEIDEPIIQKTEADAQSTLYISLFSDRYSQLEISDFADRYVKEALQTVPGVAEVRIFGERRYSMRIWLDPERMAAYGLTTQDRKRTRL